jgi:gas vesicle protein
MDNGFIALHRKIRDHWIWEEPQYLKWWIDLLLMVNHKPKKILLNGNPVIIGVGEYHTSETKLSERWYASRKAVDNFLRLLEKDGMITLKKSRQNGTTVKVCNYQTYQAFYSIDGTSKAHQENNDSTSKAHKRIIQQFNNEEQVKKKVIKKEKKFTPPTVEEIRDYCLERNNNVNPQKFFDHYSVADWHDVNGNKIRNWKQKVIRWEGEPQKINPSAVKSPAAAQTGNPFLDLYAEELEGS